MIGSERILDEADLEFSVEPQPEASASAVLLEEPQGGAVRAREVGERDLDELADASDELSEPPAVVGAKCPPSVLRARVLALGGLVAVAGLGISVLADRGDEEPPRAVDRFAGREAPQSGGNELAAGPRGSGEPESRARPPEPADGRAPGAREGRDRAVPESNPEPAVASVPADPPPEQSTAAMAPVAAAPVAPAPAAEPPPAVESGAADVPAPAEETTASDFSFGAGVPP